MKYIITTLAICLLAFQGIAQSIDRQVIGSFGLLSATSSSTAGEVITATETVSGSFTINQGFQQTGQDTATNIKEITLEINYKLYPNPAKDVLNLNLKMDKETMFQIVIINSLGQEVSMNKTIQVSQEWFGNWNVSAYTPGLYFLVIKDEKGKQVESISFIKQ